MLHSLIINKKRLIACIRAASDGVNDLEFYLGCRLNTQSNSIRELVDNLCQYLGEYQLLNDDEWATEILKMSGDEPPITRSMKQMKLPLDKWDTPRKVY